MNGIISKVEDFVYKIFKEKSPPENVYHNITHTKEVVETVEKIGKAEKLTDEQMEILLIAAWFHDVGYVEKSKGHEELSVSYAKSFLSESNYPGGKIEKITGCILATKIPHEPKSVFEEVLCDADINHIGTKEFFDKSELLRLEKENRGGRKISNYEWLKENIDFITSQKFYTKYAKDKYEEQKNKNLLKLQKKFKKELNRKNASSLKDEKIKVEKEKLKKKTESDKKADRGIETMFRNVIRTHVSFSSMADNKAHIMISVNTIVLGAIATILARKLDTNPYLIVPTITLTLVSLAALITSVIVTRPNITSGKFTKEDIINKKANLLFFGNFYNMNLKEFSWGMQQMMNDKDYLYSSMITDFYYLGKVLSKKYKYLRISYNIFMYGMIISIIVFAVFIAMNPVTAELHDFIK